MHERECGVPDRPAGAYDAALKDLLWSGAPALLAQLSGSAVGGFIQSEQASVRRRQPDMVARLADGRLYHLELQAVSDARMPWRMLDYYGLIAERHGGVPVMQQVLFVGSGRPAMADRIGHPCLEFRYDLLDIRALDPAPLLASPAIEDVLLALLCRCDNIRERVRIVLERAVHLDSARLDDTVVRLLVLGGLRRATTEVMEEVRAMGIQIDIRSNPFLSEVFEKGIAEGEQGGRAATLVDVLEARFGTLTEEVRHRIEVADNDTLAAWARRAVTAPTLEEVVRPSS
jgi:predicted transposase YdaD